MAHSRYRKQAVLSNRIAYARFATPYLIFGILKCLWSKTGLKLPGWMRYIRHELLGRAWPARAETGGKNRSLYISPKPRAGTFNVLVIDEIVPTPDIDSGSLRQYEILKILKEEGCMVTFLPANLHRREHYTENLERLGIQVLGRPRIWSVRQHLKEEGGTYHMVVVARVKNMTAYAKDIRRYAPHAKLIFDTVDLHFLRLERQAAISGNARLLRDAQRCKKDEIRAARNADCTLTVSDNERLILKSLAPEVTVKTLSNIHEIRPPLNSFHQRKDIVFIGVYNHKPNADAAFHLVRDIWPLVKRKLPEAMLHLIGEDPNGDLSGLDGDDVIIAGHVRDLDAALEHVRVSVAPLRFGAGVKGKINMSMSRGVPMVVSPLAAEGMALEHGRDCMIAGDTEVFANMIVDLYENEEQWNRLSVAGPVHVRERFSRDIARACIRNLIQELSPPSVLAIIPTAFSSTPMLERCIEKLHRASDGVLLRIIVVLCPSDDQKLARLQSVLADSATCVAAEAPFSFAKSNNTGLKELQNEEFVLFLNDDCFFRRPGDIRLMIDAMKEHALASIGPWLKHINYAEELPDKKRTKGLYASARPVVGACMIWNRSWLDRIGHFDESFDGYGMEEADLLYRALLQGGRWMRDDRVRVDHIHHATFGKSIKDEEPHVRNLARWNSKYPGVHSWGQSIEWERNTTKT